MQIQRYLQRLILIALFCGASFPAGARVITSNDAIVVTGDRSATTNEDTRYSRPSRNEVLNSEGYDRNQVIIYGDHNNSYHDNNNGAIVIKDGQAVPLQNGNADTGNGQNINVDQGRVNGSVGGVQIRN